MIAGYPNKQANVAKTSGTVSVATSSTVVVGENKSRAEITIVNDGANVVYLMLATAWNGSAAAAPTAVANQGIRLNSGGGSWTSNAYTGPIAGIALTGATGVTVAEI